MYILTFDIEEWYIEKTYYGGRTEMYQEYDRFLKSILDLLDERHIKATFFCLGKIATDFPKVIKSIADCGHEIGCHSNRHLWLTKMTDKVLKEDTQEAIKSLQDVSGQKVVSYRAPAFSIGEKNKWALGVIAECGIQRDSSIFPSSRDIGGFPSFLQKTPIIINYENVTIKEFPISTTKLFGRELGYSGGGYFRLFPYYYVKYIMKRNDYVMTYFHISDLIHDNRCMMSRLDYENYFKEKGELTNRVKRYIKSNIGTKYAYDNMSDLIKVFHFNNLDYADKLINWEETIILKL